MYSFVIKHGTEKNQCFTHDVPFRTSIDRGFSCNCHVWLPKCIFHCIPTSANPCCLWRRLREDASVYLLCMSLAVHVRIPPPLGQVPPLMDPLLVYVQGCLAMTMTLQYGVNYGVQMFQPTVSWDLSNAKINVWQTQWFRAFLLGKSCGRDRPGGLLLVGSFFLFLSCCHFFWATHLAVGQHQQLNIDELYTGGFQAEEQGRLAILRGSFDVSLNQKWLGETIP